MTYLEVQRQLVDKLREIGIYYGYDDRLDLFWLRTRLYRDSERDFPFSYIDQLVELRKKGLEPIHENGKYV